LPVATAGPYFVDFEGSYIGVTAGVPAVLGTYYTNSGYHPLSGTASIFPYTQGGAGNIPSVCGVGYYSSAGGACTSCGGSVLLCTNENPGPAIWPLIVPMACATLFVASSTTGTCVACTAAFC